MNKSLTQDSPLNQGRPTTFSMNQATTTKPTQAAPQPASSVAQTKYPKRPPLTLAERQRRYREKKRAQIEALKSNSLDSAIARLERENSELRAELQKARETDREKTFRLSELMKLSKSRDEEENGVKDCIKTILYRATLGTKKMFETAMRERGYIEWLYSESKA